jgi:hypothetical protein
LSLGHGHWPAVPARARRVIYSTLTDALCTGETGDIFGEHTRRLLTTISGGSKGKPASSLHATKPTQSTSSVSQGSSTVVPAHKPSYTPYPSVGRRHGVREENVPSIRIESYVTEMARVVGAGSIVAAFRANGGVIFFFSNIESVDIITADGLSIDYHYLNVSSLDRTPVKNCPEQFTTVYSTWGYH